MSYAPPLLVAAEPRQGNPYGLFSVLAFRPSTDPHWESGIEWEPLACSNAATGASGLIEDPSCDNPPEKHFASPVGHGTANPFYVYGDYKCGTFGHSLEQSQGFATARLLAHEEAQVGARMWSAVYAPGATDVTPTPGTAVSPQTGLALLEDALAASYGSLGVIHGTRGSGVLLNGTHLSVKGNQLLTGVGTPFVAEAGYPGSGPAGQKASGTTWLYATPSLFGYRGDVFTSSERRGDLLDRQRNDLYAIAERAYAIGMDPCPVYAVEISQL